jgi:hypothetical protein
VEEELTSLLLVVEAAEVPVVLVPMLQLQEQDQVHQTKVETVVLVLLQVLQVHHYYILLEVVEE